ncbi:MAG: hypothetical protein M1836_006412 [Candelina mexicana]|nr:MAG: hypothetical protein M1836_006412 [Candelina mexicana]
MGIVLETSLSIRCGVRNAAFYDLSEIADIEVTQEQYLDSLLKLSEDIGKLRNDANEGIQTLSKLVDSVRTGRADKVTFPKVENQPFIRDDWPMLTVGYVHQPDFEKADKPDSILPKLSTKYDANAPAQYVTYLLYRQAAEHALEVHLEPVKSVIADLCDHVPRWNSRLPPAPKEDKKEKHVRVMTPSDDAKPDPNARDISFAVTYLSSQGESAESHWTDPVPIAKMGAKIEISVRRVTVPYNPTAGLEQMRDPKTNTLLPSTRGVARCVYAKVSLHGELEYRHVGILADEFDPTEKEISLKDWKVVVVMTNMAEEQE